MEERKILVVEDETAQLNLLTRILEDAGYNVAGAKDGVEAREAYLRLNGEIDLVLSDMALPKFGGWTVFLMLRQINPDVKMILTSGYLDERVRAELIKGGVKDFIAKPYRAETIVSSVKQALTGQL
jgi:two-component system, cell cycle sensor histidine kinase and response regulator CckA